MYFNMRCGDLFSSGIVRMHKLHGRLLFYNYRQDFSMYVNLCSGNLCSGWSDCLHKLRSWIVSSVHGINDMYSVSWRIVLRHHGLDCSDGKLCCGILFSYFGDFMLKLYCWNLSGFGWIIELHIMHCRIILRHHGPYCSDGKLCYGILFSCVCNSVFKLSIGDIFINCIFDQLFKLSNGSLSGHNWINSMYSMPRRVVLCHHGSHSCNGCLLSWKILCCVINYLFKLFIGNLSSLNGIHDLYSMSRRIVLRHHGLDCSDGQLCCGIIFRYFGDFMLKLYCWNLSGFGWLIELFVMHCRIILFHYWH